MSLSVALTSIMTVFKLSGPSSVCLMYVERDAEGLGMNSGVLSFMSSISTCKTAESCRKTAIVYLH